MLLWSGLVFILLGFASFAIDRRAAGFFHARIDRSLNRRIARTTDWAKGAHWLAIALAALVLAQALRWTIGERPWLHTATDASLAFLASLAIGTVVVHILKIVLGRRRPRDELEHDFYGFRPLRFDPQHDSFPSGHALTIVCVAVIASGVWPLLAPLWFAVALYLAFTRAFLNAHFVSDVLIGTGLGLLTARAVVLYLVPALWQPWF
ncbi:MAG TPA: phosphatase PAP2 family protein [Rhizomicrobium sp.]|nr:phosphatase PAP2 family protein [Rhizomicrobium sp.]